MKINKIITKEQAWIIQVKLIKDKVEYSTN
jgi:hypothetical protein